MSETLRALVVVLGIATAVFALARAPLCSAGVSPADYDRRRNLWYVVTLAAFLSHDFWLFTGASAAMLLMTARSEKNVTALFLCLLFAVPMVEQDVPGLGMFQYLFQLNYARLLSLVLLVPAAIRLRSGGRAAPVGAHAADRFLLAYLGLRLVLHLSAGDTLTNVIRWSVFYAAIDVFVPYYVASRSIRSRREALEALACLALAGAILAALAAFEAGKQWLLYAELTQQLDMDWGYGKYLGRGDGLRALVTTGQPLALGYVLVVALGAMLVVRPDVRSGPASGWLPVGLIALGIVASLSRGPWLGAVVLLIAFLALGRQAARRLMTLSLGGSLAVLALAVSPLGDKVVDYLPFIGRVDEENVTYRTQLIESSIALIEAHPFFGSYDFTSALEDMRQGQGIIDIVNTYLGVVLGTGLVGLALFLGAWVAPLVSVLSIACADEQVARLRAGLAAIIVASLFIILTTSSITVIPFVYWTVLGLTVAVSKIERNDGRREVVPAVASFRPLR